MLFRILYYYMLTISEATCILTDIIGVQWNGKMNNNENKHVVSTPMEIG